MSHVKSILIVGGTGLIGQTLCRLILEEHPDWQVILSGRNQKKAQKLLEQYPQVSFVRMDIEDAHPLLALPQMPHAVVVAVNDNKDHVLLDYLEKQIPLLDIARWLERIVEAQTLYQEKGATSPLIFASGWMASAASVILANFTHLGIKQADIDILLDLEDATGPDSVSNFINAHLPFTIYENGQSRSVKGISEPKVVDFPKKGRYRTWRMSSPEQVTLVHNQIAKGISVRLAFNDKLTNWGFAVLINSKLWQCLPKSLRRNILYSDKSKSPQPHQFLISLKCDQGQKLISVSDEKGQSHLTAASSLCQLEQLLDFRASYAPLTGIVFPEQSHNQHEVLKRLQELGVVITKIEET